MKDEDKKKMLSDIVKSLKNPGGTWNVSVTRWKQKLNDELAKDSSAPAINSASLAARARALGYHEDMSLEDMASSVLLKLNEFYADKVIRFVEYDETVYEYIKEGETTRNAEGKKRRPGEACAKASDWYRILDQRVN